MAGASGRKDLRERENVVRISGQEEPFLLNSSNFHTEHTRTGSEDGTRAPRSPPSRAAPSWRRAGGQGLASAVGGSKGEAPGSARR